jgi:DtxR family Mn-dependent transcriptional regulator
LPGQKGILTGVDDHTSSFLQYLDELGIALGVAIELLDRTAYDQSAKVQIAGKEYILSEKASQNLFLRLE